MIFGPLRGRHIFPFFIWLDWLIRWCRGATCVGGCEDIVPVMAAAGQCGAPITTCWAQRRKSPRNKFMRGFRMRAPFTAMLNSPISNGCAIQPMARNLSGEGSDDDKLSKTRKRDQVLS